MSHDDPTCGCSRRDIMKLGAAGLTWGLFGLTLPRSIFLREAYGLAPDPAIQKYDAAIQIFFDGGPSQTDTWDPKPGSPNNVFPTINVGVSDIYGQNVLVADHFTNLVNLVQTDSAIKLGIIRSMTHGNGDHATAQRWVNAFWQSPVEGIYPSAAAVMSQLFAGQSPLGISSVLINGSNGTAANDAKGSDCPTAFTVFDVNTTHQLMRRPTNVDAARYDRRKQIMEAFNNNYTASRPDATARAWDQAVHQAIDITNTGAAASAFDLTGKTILPGRAGGGANAGNLRRLTLAQELVTAGIPYVAVGIGGNDTHTTNRNNVTINWRDTVDSAVAQMARNLKATGKRVLIIMGGEFGRTPQTVAPDAQGVRRDGRDHYPSGFSWAMLSINQPAFRTTAVGNTGPDGLWRVGSATPLVDPIYPGALGGFLYRSLGFAVGTDARTDVPIATGSLQPPVDRTLATSTTPGGSVWLQQRFGLA